jgi:ubiquinone/menaquinone biosynthesis C-methylase UbiE
MIAVVMILLAVAFALDALRMRGRLAALAVLDDDDDHGPAGDHLFVVAPGVDLDESTRRAASAFAKAHELDVVDLVPHDLPALRALQLAQFVDPKAYRNDLIAPGRTAGHALLVSASLAARLDLKNPRDAVHFAELAKRAKLYAPGRADVAIAPDERARDLDLDDRYDALRVVFGPGTPAVMAMQAVVLALLAFGVAYTPTFGFVALGAWHAQPLVAILGTKLRPRGWIFAVLLRAPLELWLLARTLLGRHRALARDLSPRRTEYAHLLERGNDFFEQRRDSCPLCGGTELVVHLRTTDLFQRKPGTFTLERCRGCRHLFQNPRLSIAGLSFYYKDFYDGLGEDGMEFMFGLDAAAYRARAEFALAVRQPTRWLDVGAGHGHFCAAARARLPATQFDGLDISASIVEAKRRGWVQRGYRGLFPDLASKLAGKYDAVSMSHYLEHTIDPRAELAAARTTLADGGCLMIELPDPEFALGRLLRRYWLPWFQPQHLHLYSTTNLERLLREHGFEPVAWQRGAAHQRIDFTFASWMVMQRIAPPAKLPWRWRGRGATAWRAVAWPLVGAPLFVLAFIVDHALSPIFRRAKVSNTFRVVARKV